MRTYILFLLILISNLSWAMSLDKGCKYVIAPNGLNLREKPDVKSKIIAHLKYGEKVQDAGIENRDSIEWVLDGGVKVYGNWIQAYTSRPYGEETLMGYVFNAYISSHMPEIPSYSLYYFDHLYITTYGNEEVVSGELSYDINIDTYNYSAYEDCYQRYLPHKEDLMVNGTIGKSDSENIIGEYLKIEKVDSSIEQQRLVHNYSINVDFQPLKKPYNDGGNSSIEFNAQQFFLHTSNDDSIHIHDYTGVYDSKNEYVGFIPGSNQYVTLLYFESEEYSLWDKKTGKKARTTSPLISPDGLLAIQLAHHFYESGGQFYLEYLDEKRNLKQTLNISFQTWVPYNFLTDAFWISNNELILKAFPIDYTIEHDDRSIIPYEYLKVTIH